MSSQAQDDRRIIGRWTIGSTLGKGGYSWVKRGQDIKTGKIVALKFMEKADSSWVQEQAKQVETEIEALKNIRHQNVMKLYAYNLNAQYPLAKDPKSDTGGSRQYEADQKYIDTILLVLEYAPGGELFDILYYTSALKEKVARTYFKQVVAGLEACHNAGVVHRDLKPQNLLLDAKYNLKITDFGLSKIIQSDADAIMKTTYVGTKGYQAPELILNQKYDLKCDIFSVGVILFILLAGYPPFEQASRSDKWFKPLMKGQIEKFWKAHSKSPIAQNADAKDLLTKMLCFDPKQRISMNGIKAHPWCKGETLRQKELIAEIRDRHRKAEKKRRMDVRKMEDLAQSINPNRPIPGIEKAQLELFPEQEVEGYFGDIYTYISDASGERKWYDIYNFIEESITSNKGNGSAVFDFTKGILNCEMKIGKRMKINGEKVNVEETVKFSVKIYQSRMWQDKYLEADDPEEIKEKQEHIIYVVRVQRISGSTMTFRNIKNQFLMVYCSSILKGLPKWATKMEDEIAISSTDDDDDQEEDDQKEPEEAEENENDADEDYDKLCSEINWNQAIETK